MKNKSIFLLTITFFPLLSICQTCIIAKIDSNTITIGSDTKFTIINNDFITNKSDTIYKTGQKVFTSGQYNYAIIGYKADLQKQVINGILNESLTLYPSFFKPDISTPGALLNAYAKKYQEKLLEYLTKLKQSSPTNFITVLETTKPFISEFLLCGFYNGKPYICAIAFTLNDGLFQPSLTYNFQCGNWVVAGEGDKITELMDIKSTWKHGTIKGINKLLKMESKISPKTVGKPFDIFVVTENGTQKLTNNNYSSSMDNY